MNHLAVENAQQFLAIVLDAHDRSGIYQIRVVCLTSIARLLESLLKDESCSQLEQLDLKPLYPTLINALGWCVCVIILCPVAC